MSDIWREFFRITSEIEAVRVQKRERLKDLDFFILDNSIRESTVGQLRAHTIENKKAIYQEVKRCGIDSIVVATFAHMTRVDDDFVQWLSDEGEDFSKFFSFSEVTEGIKNERYDTESVPVALLKNRKYGLYNTIFEVDLANPDVAWDTKFTVKETCQLLLKWIKWVHDNHPGKQPRILLNFRDFPIAMSNNPMRVLKIVEFLAKIPHRLRMFGIAFEDPMGEYLPEELEAWTGSVRRVMDANDWSHGKILVHVHQKWDLQTASQLDCLSAGADGVWASLCEEGAAMGHASSVVTLLNLIRLGNTEVLKKYNCTEVRKAAINVTKITTGKPPHPKQVVYGERSLDLVLDFVGFGDFNLGEFFGEETTNRITTLASPEMIRDRLVKLFGDDEQFTLEIAQDMKEKIMEDLRSVPPRKEEYQSPCGIAVLFDRAGGKMTEKMRDEIAKVRVKEPHHKALIAEIRELWDRWDLEDRVQKDDCLQFDTFYHGFMAPYFGCYRCIDTKLALKAIDMDANGFVDWNEFMVYIKWALHQYPDVDSADDLLSITFEKGLIPAMRDEKLRHVDELAGVRVHRRHKR